MMLVCGGLFVFGFGDPAGVQTAGFVISLSGQPVEEATVEMTAFANGDKHVDATQTRQDGWFGVSLDVFFKELDDRQIEIRCNHPRYHEYRSEYLPERFPPKMEILLIPLKNDEANSGNRERALDD